MKYKFRIKYLELDENRYIENDQFKIRLNESGNPKFGTWDELWAKVRSDIEKIAKYEDKNLRYRPD